MTEPVLESRVLPIFPTFVWYLQLKPEVAESINLTIEKRLETLAAAKPELPPGLLQTDQNLHQDEALSGLVPNIISAVQGVLDFLKVKYTRFQITGCWANVAEGGQGHIEHCHPNNFLSGVYYVRAPDGGDAITFHDPRQQPNIFMPPTRELSTENAGKMNVGIKPGTLMVFPAWLHHSVPPNRSTDQRISVSFNIMFSNFENEMSPPMWEGNL